MTHERSHLSPSISAGWSSAWEGNTGLRPSGGTDWTAAVRSRKAASGWCGFRAVTKEPGQRHGRHESLRLWL